MGRAKQPARRCRERIVSRRIRDMESAQEYPSPPQHKDVENEYEQSRLARIEENKRRLQELGILKLSGDLLALKRTSNLSYSASPKKKPHLPSLNPTRRSSRLQNVTPVSYSELPQQWKESESKRPLVPAGSIPEVYTEEHEKLLGSCETEWVLFRDGCGADGKRIYDNVKGKTCHQCRQKTLGLRTFCSQCQSIQGQFCGDCLYMRYGENILEARNNPKWVCPVCRGICNCSICRVRKGWAPTGSMYRQVKSEGYKSVAHYLLLTKRSSGVLNNLETASHEEQKTEAKASNEEQKAEVTASNEEQKASNEEQKAEVIASNEEQKAEAKASNEEQNSEAKSGAERSLEFISEAVERTGSASGEAKINEENGTDLETPTIWKDKSEEDGNNRISDISSVTNGDKAKSEEAVIHDKDRRDLPQNSNHEEKKKKRKASNLKNIPEPSGIALRLRSRVSKEANN